MEYLTFFPLEFKNSLHCPSILCQFKIHSLDWHRPASQQNSIVPHIRELNMVFLKSLLKLRLLPKPNKSIRNVLMVWVGGPGQQSILALYLQYINYRHCLGRAKEPGQFPQSILLTVHEFA